MDESGLYRDFLDHMQRFPAQKPGDFWSFLKEIYETCPVLGIELDDQGGIDIKSAADFARLLGL
jgi:hypothetical protein